MKSVPLIYCFFLTFILMSIYEKLGINSDNIFYTFSMDPISWSEFFETGLLKAFLISFVTIILVWITERSKKKKHGKRKNKNKNRKNKKKNK